MFSYVFTIWHPAFSNIKRNVYCVWPFFSLWFPTISYWSNPKRTKPLLQVVLFGESFGGLLSLAVALRLGREKLKGPTEDMGVSYQNNWLTCYHLQLNQHCCGRLDGLEAILMFFSFSPQSAQASNIFNLKLNELLSCFYFATWLHL